MSYGRTQIRTTLNKRLFKKKNFHSKKFSKNLNSIVYIITVGTPWNHKKKQIINKIYKRDQKFQKKIKIIMILLF